MDIGFETIGNATVICYDRKPVLITDPWLEGNPYFGSWVLSHEIPEEQMEAAKQCEYVWVSHGHPDHLSVRSLRLLKDAKILIPDHVGSQKQELRGQGVKYPGKRVGVPAAPVVEEVLLDRRGHSPLIPRDGRNCSENPPIRFCGPDLTLHHGSFVAICP